MDEDLIASGRDADILALGHDKVVRRARDGRSLAAEAEVMRYVREAGFPVPEVFEVRAGGTEVVMERLAGPTMIELIGRRPWQLRSHASTLAGLHRRLGAIGAPATFRQLPDGGDRVVHLDLHPLNVIMTAGGPVVIDWTNAKAGLPASDMASTWAILASSEIPGSAKDQLMGRIGRAAFVRALLRSYGEPEAVAAQLPHIIEARLTDRNLLPSEAAYLTAWLERLT